MSLLMLVGLAAVVLLIVAILILQAWRRHIRRCSEKGASSQARDEVDAWSESARRLRVASEDVDPPDDQPSQH